LTSEASVILLMYCDRAFVVNIIAVSQLYRTRYSAKV